MADNEKWDEAIVLGINGAPWETIPGKMGGHMPVETTEDGQELPLDDETNNVPDNDDEGDEIGVKLSGGLDKLHVSREVVSKYGMTPGFPACREIQRIGHLIGRLGYHHSETCTSNIFEEMSKDQNYRALVDKHEKLKRSGFIDVVTDKQQQQQMMWVRQTIWSI